MLSANMDIVRHIYINKILLEKRSNELIYKDFNLTESSFIPLRLIREGVHTIFEMKKYSTESSASLTQKLNRLEKLGLITRHINKTDKRKWTFKLSAKGKKIIVKILTKKEKALSELFRDFSKKEKELFIGLLHKIQKRLRTETESKLPPCCATPNKTGLK